MPLVRIAEVLNVSLDYLVVDGVARRPLNVADHGLGERLVAIGELDDGDRTSLSMSSTRSSPRAGKALAGGITGP
ncbi:MAG: hypothetical protein LC721_04175 [Actinobacteria bacterium]|nr:hypothetical protein [Actinomycetota bacterium]